MVNLKFIRATLSEKERDAIINDLTHNRITVEEAASKLGMSVEDVRSATEEVSKDYGRIGYDNDVQKMISFKGTIREMMLTATNRKGGKYPLKVVNIYVKPNTERYYEENIYSVEKDKIRKGTPSEGYYPDSAMWVKNPKNTGKSKMQGETETARKTRIGKSNIRVKLNKRIKRGKIRRSK